MASDFKVSVKNTFISVQQCDQDEASFPRQCSAPIEATVSFADARRSEHASMVDTLLDSDVDDNDHHHRDFPFESSFHAGMHAQSGTASESGDAGDMNTNAIPSEWQDKTSVMVRNLPYKCTPALFLNELSKAGFAGLYDYAFVPTNPRSRTSKGYAFVNFASAIIAYKFKSRFDSKLLLIPSLPKPKKLLEVIPANLQGYADNATHYIITGSQANVGSEILDLEPSREDMLCSFSDERASQETWPQPDYGEQQFRGEMTWTLNGFSHDTDLLSHLEDYHQALYDLQGHANGQTSIQRTRSSLPLEQSNTSPMCAQCNAIGGSGHRFCQWCGSVLSVGSY